ncbi:MAG: TonB-dependent receptor [Sandaracinaceae bacterium]|nr:TonB-dependent receptor [Sandaracinaceae bacterium]
MALALSWGASAASAQDAGEGEGATEEEAARDGGAGGGGAGETDAPGVATEGDTATGDAADDDDDDDGGSESAEAPPGVMATSGVRGRIVDSATGQGLPDAVVIARAEGGGITNTITNDTGGYVLALDPGLYSILSYTDLYHGARMPRVVVRSHRWRDLTLTLDAIDPNAVVEEIEIVYRADTSSAAAQDQLRAASSGIAEGMGSQQMSRSGASDAGSAARNVVGVSLEGTNLNIRGLGGRYTVVLLNGVQLPSTDPDLPSVDLDLFPTSVIDNLSVAKAFLPNLPANFAGGVLDIRTVRFPRQFTFQLGASVGGNTLATFQDRLAYRGGDLDWLGIDDGTRRFPSGYEDAPLVTTRTGPYTHPDQLRDAALRFPNIWQYQRQMAPPGFGLDLTMGDALDLGGGNRFGYLVTAFYDNDTTRTVGLARPRPTLTETGELSVFNDYRTESGATEARLGALGTASLELGQSDVVSFLTLFNRSAIDSVDFATGTNAELAVGELTERWQLQMIARQLWFNQLRGDHRNMFDTPARLRWSVYGSHATREEPDRRTVTYGPQGGAFRWLEKAGSGERFYSDLGQLDLGGNADVRFPLWSEGWGTLGGHVRNTQRDFTIRRIRMLQDPANMDQSVYQADVETLFDEQALGTISRLREFTRANDSYRAESGYYAGFAMLETPLGEQLSFTGGARFEAFEQIVESRSPFGGADAEIDPANRTRRTDVDVLPGAALRLQVADGMYLRAAYGMTVARPQVRELAPYQYYDFIRDRNIQGNPELARTLIQNADLRWEWFFGEGEILALSGFYKYFDRPIELQIFNPGNFDAQYINADYAHNLGAEVELRFNFRHFHPDLRILSLQSNLALIWSTVQLPDALSGAVQSERPLFGQAPYVANVSLQLDEPSTGLMASLVYNVVGPRITDVGTRVNEFILPNITRAPFHRLDLIVGWRIEEHFQLRLKLRNILFQVQDFYQGDFLEQSVDPGASASLSLQYTY